MKFKGEKRELRIKLGDLRWKIEEFQGGKENGEKKWGHV